MHKIKPIIWSWKRKSWQNITKKQEDVIIQLHIEVQFQRELIETIQEQMKQNLENEVKCQIVDVLEEVSTSESPTNSSTHISNINLFYWIFSFMTYYVIISLKPKYQLFNFYLIYSFLYLFAGLKLTKILLIIILGLKLMKILLIIVISIL